jgi:hypothetical protein
MQQIRTRIKQPSTKEKRSFEPSDAKAEATKIAGLHQRKESRQFPGLPQELQKYADPPDVCRCRSAHCFGHRLLCRCPCPRMFKKDLAGDRTRSGKKNQAKHEKRHSFSPARHDRRAIKKAPSATRLIPSQRCCGIFSPRKAQAPIATRMWFVAARLNATISGTDLSAYSHERSDSRIAEIPVQIQRETKNPYPGVPSRIPTPIFKKICAAAVRTMLIES